MAISDWLTVTPDTGNSGITTITVSASSLLELSNRAKSIHITSGNLTEDVLVKQKTTGASLSISPGRLVLPDSGGTGTLSVICSGVWTISPMRSWIQFSASAGTGSTTITVTASSNTSKSDRGATFFINSGSLQDRTDIVQYKEASLTLFPTSFNLGHNGNTQFIMVTPSMQGQTWEIQNYPDWVTAITPTSSTQEEVVTFSYGPNTSTSARTGNISFLYRGIPQQVALTQSGEQTFEISPSAVTFPQSGGSSALTISSSTSWKIFYPSFVTGPENGSGSTAITITALPNTGLYKEGVITAQTNDGLISHTINCVLDGPVFVYSPTAITANWTGGSATVNITADTAWQIISYPNWVTPSTTQGSGNGSVTFTFGVNEGTNSRTESVQFRCRNRVFSVNITQKPRDLIIIPSSVTFTTYSATSTTVNLISGYNWEATNIPSWVTLSQTAGTGNIYITISADTNPAVDRTGSVVFTCNGQNYSFEIQQYGMERFGLWWEVTVTGTTCYLNNRPNNLYISIDGATPVPYGPNIGTSSQTRTVRVYSPTVWKWAMAGETSMTIQNAENPTTLRTGPGITVVEDEAITQCRFLTAVTFDTAVTVGDSAFYRCAIESISFGGTTDVGNASFVGYDYAGYRFRLNNLNTTKLRNIGEHAFVCAASGNLVLGGEINTIADEAFVDPDDSGYGQICDLTTVTINGNGNTTIGESAFNNGSKLQSIVISGVSSIGDYAFADFSTGVTAITVYGNGNTTIGDYAFTPDASYYPFNCLLEFVNLSGITSLGESAFASHDSGSGERRYTKIHSVNLTGVKNIGRYSFEGSQITELNLPDIETLGWAFNNCTALTTVHIGSHLTGYLQGFAGCTSLNTIYLDNTNTLYANGFTGVPATGTFYYHAGTDISSFQNNTNLSGWTFTTY